MMRKYRVCYYGWISSYGDWDCDDFIVTAPNIKEAKKIMHESLSLILLKGEPSIQLNSEYEKQMK